MPGPAAARAAWTQPELRPLSRPAEPVRVPASRRPAVWPVRRKAADWGCSPRSWPKVAVRRRVSVQRPLARRSAHAPVRAGAVGMASREAGAVRQRRAPPVAQVVVARPVLQPPSAPALSRAGSQGLSRFVAAAATARRRNPLSEDRTGRPQSALPGSHLLCRSQTHPLTDVPHLEDAVGVQKFTANGAAAWANVEPGSRQTASYAILHAIQAVPPQTRAVGDASQRLLQRVVYGGARQVPGGGRGRRCAPDGLSLADASRTVRRGVVDRRGGHRLRNGAARPAADLGNARR